MSNIFKDIDIKKLYTILFGVMINKKNLDANKIKLKSHTKIFLFTTSDM